jgi:hypothetical protein
MHKGEGTAGVAASPGVLYTRAAARSAAFGHVAEWLRSGLQNRLLRFNSGRGLHSLSL